MIAGSNAYGIILKLAVVVHVYTTVVLSRTCIYYMHMHMCMCMCMHMCMHMHMLHMSMHMHMWCTCNDLAAVREEWRRGGVPVVAQNLGRRPGK